jgi:hypothetical protein
MCLPRYVTEFESHLLVSSVKMACVLFLLCICSVVIVHILFIAHNVCVCVCYMYYAYLLLGILICSLYIL